MALGRVHILGKNIGGRGISQMLMLLTWGEVGVDEKITDYVDMG